MSGTACGIGRTSPRFPGTAFRLAAAGGAPRRWRAARPRSSGAHNRNGTERGIRGRLMGSDHRRVWPHTVDDGAGGAARRKARAAEQLRPKGAGDVLTLVTGGVRSGKSAYAETLAGRAGPRVLYIATLPAERSDEEMRARIDAHRQRRPPAWTTLEAAADPGGALRGVQAQDHDAVLLDCLTVLTGTWLWQADPLVAGATVVPADVAASTEAMIMGRANRLLAALAAFGRPAVVVTSEVGSGVVPPYPLGRLFQDVLGRCNQRFAAVADHVYLLVAGLPVCIKRGTAPWPG